MRETNNNTNNNLERSQISQKYFLYGSAFYDYFKYRIWVPLMKSPVRSSALFFFCFFLLVGAFVFTRLFDSTVIGGRAAQVIPKKPWMKIDVPFNCSALNITQTCPTNYPTQFNLEKDPGRQSSPTCPEYFRWIYEDLRPWSHTGITREMLERTKRTANFRLVIINGKAYVEKYKRKVFQTRDVLTLWGILQLLRRYPGKVPDLDLMFDLYDWPESVEYNRLNAKAPLPLFRYCGNDATLYIVFPDWSFWGWPEINIKPWESLLRDLKEANKRSTWMEREPHAYWKGNPFVAKNRIDLLKCNVSDKQDWNARVYAQNWKRESREGYKESNLANQCIHRYKIYIEGSTWSVSEKYILACDSVTLLVKPHYYDFFTRSLIPMHHYWPIRDNDKCKSIKFAVDWGNTHKKKAQEIGKAASEFIQEELKMEYVYDYMFHLLSEYASLLRFKPTIPRNAVELCAEKMACQGEGLQRKFMIESMVKGPAKIRPCTMPPPYDYASLHAILKREENLVEQVEIWENKFWENQK